MFFGKKYITIINPKWEIVKANVKCDYLPRKDEYIFIDENYYEVLNVVHKLDKKNTVLVVVQKMKKIGENT
jgi:hypothetical protein